LEVMERPLFSLIFERHRVVKMEYPDRSGHEPERVDQQKHYENHRDVAGVVDESVEVVMCRSGEPDSCQLFKRRAQGFE